MKMYNKKRKYVPKNLFYITLDAFTLLPLFNIYEIVQTTSGFEVSKFIQDLSHLQELPRFYRVILYFTELRNTVGLNQLLIIFIYFLIRVICITLGISCIFYVIEGGYVDIGKYVKSWNAMDFEANSQLDYFEISLITIGNLVINNSHGLVGIQTSEEVSILLVAITVGYLFRIMIAYGELTSVYIKTLAKHFEFTWRYHLIENFMKDWEIEKDVQEKVIIYFHDSWKRQRGIRQVPDSIKFLPINLYKEVALDISWDVFKHSHLFAEEDMAFKKALSLSVKYKFFLPGDIIFKTGDKRYEMFYVNSGIIQVLSDEDDESPIISFSNGTLIGEMCVLMFHHTKTVLKCTTHCEIFVLSLTNFYRTLLIYSSRSKHFHLALKNRIQKAKIGQKIVKRNSEMKRHSLEIPETTIKSLKRRWRLILKIQKESKKNAPIQISEFGNIDGVHTSEFLDMLVLSDNVDLKLEAIFLTKYFPFILDPDSDLAVCWQFIILICIFAMDLLMPIYVCYNYRPTGLKIVLICLDFSYLLDVYILMSSAIKLKQQTISTFKQILLKRCSQIGFMIDVFVALPIDYYLEYFTKAADIFVYYYKLVKLLKTYRVMRYLDNVQETNWNYPVLARLITYIFIALFLIHITSSFHFAIMCDFYGFCDYNFINYEIHYVSEKIFFSFFNIASLFMGTHADQDAEGNLILFGISYVIALMGCIFLTYCFCEFCALFVLRAKHENEYNGEMNNLRNYLFALKIPRSIFRKLQDVLMFTWSFNKNFVMLGNESTLTCTTKSLRNEILQDRITDILKMVPLFEGLPEWFFKELYLRANLLVLPPNHEILKYEADVNYLRIISRGYCKMISHLPMDDAYRRSNILGPGDLFPTLEFVHSVPSFIEVHTVTACELLRIPMKDIIIFMKIDNSFFEDYTKILNQHKLLNERTLMKMPLRMPELIPLRKKKSIEKSEYFTYTLLDQTEDLFSKMKTDFEENMNEKLGKFVKVMKFVMLKHTIHPESKGFIWFQGILIVLILLRISLSLMRFNLFAVLPKKYSIVDKIMDFLIDAVLYLNMYVSLHVQYFSKKGILVTHHYYTALNYLRNNFIPDVIATIPWQNLQFMRIFGDRNVQVTDLMITICFRMLIIYRVFGLLSYFQSESSKMLLISIRIVKVFIIIFILLAFFTNAFLIVTCPYDHDIGYCVCSSDSWISTTFDTKANNSALHLTLLSFFVVLTAVTGAATGAFDLLNANEIITYFIIMITGIIVRTYFVAIITSAGIGGATTFNRFQQQINLFIKFVKNETVEEGIVQETINYYEYIFKKTKGRDFLTFTKNFHSTLRCEFTYSVFESTLKQVQIFRNMQTSFYLHISAEFNLVYYKKDTTVIRCNDVQENLYFVHKGSVDIVIARQKICTLEKGGVFGNFHNKCIRQTIFAYTKVHTELIVINCYNFHKFIKSYPKLMQRLKNINSMNCEFWESAKEETEFRERIDEQQSTVNVNLSYDSESVSQFKSSNLLKLMSHKRIVHTSSSYLLWYQIMDFHIAAIASIVLMYFIFLGPEWFNLYFNILKYCTDVLYLTKFYVGFSLTYTDPESGLIITDKKMIAIRYVKSIFWLDIFTILPMELIPILMKTSYMYRRVFAINRLFRIIYVILYYEKRRFKLKGLAVVRWSFLIYTVYFVLQVLTSIWYVVWFWDEKCIIYSKTKDGTEIPIDISKSPFRAGMMALYQVLNLFTQTGLKSIKPENYRELIVTIFIIFVTQYLTAVLARTVTSHLVIKYSTLSTYEYSLQNLKEYLKCRELSPPILNRTWQYLLNLWMYRKGESLPMIISTAPIYLKQDIMYAIYGKHLENHFLFIKTHVDFLRQLVCHLKPLVFFPNDCIVEKNDIDGTMYFVHSGEVIVYDVMGNNVNVVRVLEKSMTFGEAQGLYNVAHTFTYKAQTVCDILLLRRCDWDYLIEWFPASFDQINIGAKENLISVPQAYTCYKFE